MELGRIERISADRQVGPCGRRMQGAGRRHVPHRARIWRSACARACSTTSACRPRSNGTSATSRGRYAINVDLQMEGDFDALPDKHRTCVYRVVQEAMTNCVRHAEAKNIQSRRVTPTTVSCTCGSPTTAWASIRSGAATASACAASRSGSRSWTGHDDLAAGRPAARRCSFVCRCRSRVHRRCRLRVLLADDHSIVRRGLRGLLEAAGLTVVAEAADGLEAVRLCEEHRARHAHPRHRHAED